MVFKNSGSALVANNMNVSEVDLNGLYSGKDIWSFVSIKIVGKDYTIFSLDFSSELIAQEVFDSILRLTVLNHTSQLYAFIYTPNKLEAGFNSWDIYQPIAEFERQGISFNDKSVWRETSINEKFQFCSTYPKVLVVPASISDSILTHASKYRSQNRIPVLTYYYKKTGVSVTRSAQPLPGITQQRSIQDENLVHEAFKCAPEQTNRNLIVDARPATSAMAQTALGGGTENMDNYGFGNSCSRMYLGIDNIHTMRDTLNFMTENFFVDNDLNLSIDIHTLNKSRASNWLKYIRLLLSSTDKLTKSIIFNKSSILLHCSDGWDRTAQMCSLVQICLDPYYRTIEGFMILVEKDWLSFGHRFAERCNHLSSKSFFRDNSVNRVNNTGTNLANAEDTGDYSVSTSTPEIMVRKGTQVKKNKNLKLSSPIFQQFLDCVYQLLLQNPSQFEFNERFLRRLVYHLYSCQYGTFIFDNEQERIANEASKSTRSVWDYFRSRSHEFTNSEYRPHSTDGEDDWILPDLNKTQWWWQLFGRKDELTKESVTHQNPDGNTESDLIPIGSNNEGSTRKIYNITSRLATLSLDIFGKR